MELPSALREAVDRALEGVSLADLERAAERLSERYRAELRDGKAHLSDRLSALAYLATRLPATYAAVRAALAWVAELRPDFSPRTMLDTGAGPGTALWAVTEQWPSLEEAALVEGSRVIGDFGETFAKALPQRITWRTDDLRDLSMAGPSDLVVISYVLDELAPVDRAPLIEKLWQLTADVLLIVEPGTPAGWQRLLSARDQLIALGANILAPCPHAGACPLAAPDWCHFSRRVSRSRLHRQAKAADVPWEDEKFLYLAASRRAGLPVEARVIAPPRSSSGQVRLKLCTRDGLASERHLTRRDGEAYKRARKLGWGDGMV